MLPFQEHPDLRLLVQDLDLLRVRAVFGQREAYSDEQPRLEAFLVIRSLRPHIQDRPNGLLAHESPHP